MFTRYFKTVSVRCRSCTEDQKSCAKRQFCNIGEIFQKKNVFTFHVVLIYNFCMEFFPSIFSIFENIACPSRLRSHVERSRDGAKS